MFRNEHTLEYVFRLFCRMDQDTFPALMDELELTKPGSTTVLRYNALKGISRAEKMDASIRGIISTNLDADGIAGRYGAALASRLEGEYQWLEFRGRDIRVLRKERGE